MQFHVPGSVITFEVPDEWWEIANMTAFVPGASHYRTTQACSAVVPLESIVPPRRDGGKFWFRNRDTVLELLGCIRDDSELPPIQVWSKGRRNPSTHHVVRDGFHRYYLSIAVGFTEIPIEIQDFDLAEFLANEARGSMRHLTIGALLK